MLKPLNAAAMRQLLAAVAFIAAGCSAACAADDSLFIEQVAANNSIDTATQVAQPSNQLETGEAVRFRTLAPGLPADLGNAATLRQRGQGNNAHLQMQGKINAAAIFQLGNNNTSVLGITGSHNAVAVDQRGSNLDSDISVVGLNKTIVHVQRGNRISGEATPLEFTGRQRETMIILDTPQGRLTKSLP